MNTIDFKFFRYTLFPLLVIFFVFTGCKSKPEKATSSEYVNLAPLTEEELNDPQVAQSFLYAGFEGKTDEVISYLDRGMDINQTNQNGQTLLMIAAYNGNNDLVRFCIEKGAEVNARDSGGRTALMYAASGPFPETVKYLLKKGADPKAVDYDEKWTALMYAAAEGHLDVVKLLVKKGADPALADIDGDTAASFARKNGHNEVADWLESHMN